MKNNSLKPEWVISGILILLTVLSIFFNPVLNSITNSIAKSTKDCSWIINDSFQQTSCYIDLAIQEKNPELCAKVKDRGSVALKKCYLGVAKAKNDISICEKLEEFSAGTMSFNFDKVDCYDIFSKAPGADVNICAKMSSDEYKEWCYRNFVKNGNISGEYPCESVISIDEKSLCYFSDAILFFDLSMCENVSADKLTKFPVMDGPAFPHTRDHLSRDYIFVTASYRDRCYYEVNRKLVEPDNCSLIKDERVRDGCYDIVARLKVNHLICDNIKSSEVKNNCIISIIK
jgi:hypothetical protein